MYFRLRLQQASFLPPARVQLTPEQLPLRPQRPEWLKREPLLALLKQLQAVRSKFVLLQLLSQ